MPIKPIKIKRSWVKESKPFERAVDNSHFYNSRAWRNKRKKFLNSNPLCVKCNANDVVTVATVVDHVKSIATGGEKFDDNNLQSLCKYCHNSKSSSESRVSRGMGVKKL